LAIANVIMPLKFLCPYHTSDWRLRLRLRLRLLTIRKELYASFWLIKRCKSRRNC